MNYTEHHKAACLTYNSQYLNTVLKFFISVRLLSFNQIYSNICAKSWLADVIVQVQINQCNLAFYS